MTKLRVIAGFVASTMIIASSGAHSLLGWPVMRGRLAETAAPADLVVGMGIGWVFGGVCMLAFGAIGLWLLSRAWKGHAISFAPLRIIAVTYIAFGLGALQVSGGDPFYAVFIVPGLLLAFASLGSDTPLVRR